MRLILVLALIGACGDDGASSGDDAPADGALTSLNDVVDCNATWAPANYPSGCERACAAKPTYEAGMSCYATHGTRGGPVCNEGSFVIEGVRGCCETENADLGESVPVLFFTCTAPL